MGATHVDEAMDVDEEVVGVCVVRTESRPGQRRLTVTVTPDITRPAALSQHPADATEVSRIVAEFLAATSPNGRSHAATFSTG